MIRYGKFAEVIRNEKCSEAAILHHEANRPEHLEMPQRYYRHYYDLYRMSQTSVKDEAFARVELLKTVVDFKIKFYPRAWARYPEAVPKTLKLIPPADRFGALAADYEAMKDMLYGDAAEFNTVMRYENWKKKYIHFNSDIKRVPRGMFPRGAMQNKGWKKTQAAALRYRAKQ